MKFSCDKDTMLGVLSQIAKAIAVKPATPILGGIYLKVEHYNLEIQANNYSLGMSAKISVNAIDDGEIVVIGKKFLDAVRVMPNDDIIAFEYVEKEHCLEIACGRSKYSITTLDPEDFPKVTKREAENMFDISASVLKNLIKKTYWACVQDESHPLYSGCLFDTEYDSITVVGTNMHRVAVAKDKLLKVTSEPLRFIVPVDALRNAAELLPDDDDTSITIAYTGKTVSFTINNIFLTVRIIEGKFPEYQKVIPTSSATIVTVDADELRGAIERISIISKEDSGKRVSFKITQQGIEIFAVSAEVGTGKEIIFTNVEGDNVSICFNYSYIIDALKVLRSGICQLKLNGVFDPLDLRLQGDDDYIYIVTPVRS